MVAVRADRFGGAKDAEKVPAPVQIGTTMSTGRRGRIAWVESEVREWVRARISEERGRRPRVEQPETLEAVAV